MTESLFRFAGGIGLFLMGMSLLTDGLKDFAGAWLRDQLARFTGTPLRAFFSGLLATLVVQSSSATTVAVVGFVSAGLLTFPQALGVLFGASLGTSATGWIVATIGLKLKLGLYLLPTLLVGVFLRLLGRGRQVFLGNALAGFALIFVGIEFMQWSLQTVTEQVDLGWLNNTGWWGDVLAVCLGIVLTILMQSSSATVATALTALSAGTIGFEHAAAVVIGSAIGTTVTGVLAAMRANVPARRTAVAHVMFNLSTGVLALICLPLLLVVVGYLRRGLGWDETLGLAAFHTLFIGLGVLLFLPWVQSFARLVEWMVPDSGPVWTRHLDQAVRRVPSVAIAATDRALRETANSVCGDILLGLTSGQWGRDPEEYQVTVREIQDYLEQLPVAADDSLIIQERLSQLHAIDHLSRLTARLLPPFTLQRVLAEESQHALVTLCTRALQLTRQSLMVGLSEAGLHELTDLAEQLRRHREENRLSAIHDSATGKRSPAATLQLLDAYRWLDRVAAHAARVGHYLNS